MHIYTPTQFARLLWAVKPIYLVIIASVFGLLCIYGLRANNIKMVELRAAVYAADKDNADVRGALNQLKNHVNSHMNTDLTPGTTAVYPPIQLKYTYERLQAANVQPKTNEQVYQDAQASCEAQNSTDFSGRNRVPCIQAYVKEHGIDTTPKPIADAAYKYDYLSPSWSPDLAGWSAVLSVFTMVLAVVSVVGRRFVKAR